MNNMKEKLKEVTKRSDEEVAVIDEILNSHFLIGKHNKDNIIAVHIRHIREKIEINPKEPRFLKVVWGQGYKIEKL